MPSVTDIVNRALLSIGARAQVSSINPSDGSTEADACSILYTPTFESLAREAQWNCLRAQAKLSLIGAATGTPENPTGTTILLPPTPWLYMYLIPNASLAVRSLVPSAPSTGVTPQTSFNNAAPFHVPGRGQVPFVVSSAQDISGNIIEVILTDQAQAQAIYTLNQPNPATWDSLFQSAMVASLAAYLVPALSLNMQLMSAQTSIAERLVMRARVADGNEGDTVMDHNPDWMRARGGETGRFCERIGGPQRAAVIGPFILDASVLG